MPQDPRLIPLEQARPSLFLDPMGEMEGGVGELDPTVRVPLEQITEWELDWDDYRSRFNELHGGRPVQIDQWLVWEDGWRCDAYDPGGTEMPPPKDKHELDTLVRAYYAERILTTRSFHGALRNRIEVIRSIQARKSLPLRTSSVTWSRSIGEDGLESYAPELNQGALDLTAPERALGDLQKEIDYCAQKIQDLDRTTLPT